MKHPLPRASKSRSLFPASSSSPPAEQPGWGAVRAWGGGEVSLERLRCAPHESEAVRPRTRSRKASKNKTKQKKEIHKRARPSGRCRRCAALLSEPHISAAPRTEAPRPLHAAHLPALRCLAPAAFGGSAWAPLDRDRLVRSPSDNTTGHFWSS